jgi:ubiquitin thioesterase OTU1
MSHCLLVYDAGENEKYQNRVFVIYDGVHYDPLGVHEDSSDLPLQTVFPCTDDKRLLEALSLASEAKKVS